jgi:putative hydrolase of the HAD superfamily
MKPAIVFDLGKVLVDFDYTIAARKIAARGTEQLPDFYHRLGNSDILSRYETGLMTRQEFFAEIRTFTGYAGTIEEFAVDLGDIFVSIEPMIEFHADLRRRGFQTYIFSNTNDIAVEHIRRHFPFFSNFDDYLYSYKVGAMKPQSKIYEEMEKLCGRTGRDIIYLDDRPENIDAGLARGWNAILHETPDKTQELVKRIL